jgi:hypothetical protein
MIEGRHLQPWAGIHPPHDEPARCVCHDLQTPRRGETHRIERRLDDGPYDGCRQPGTPAERDGVERTLIGTSKRGSRQSADGTRVSPPAMAVLVVSLEVAAAWPPGEDGRRAVGGALAKRALDRVALVCDRRLTAGRAAGNRPRSRRFGCWRMPVWRRPCTAPRGEGCAALPALSRRRRRSE